MFHRDHLWWGQRWVESCSNREVWPQGVCLNLNSWPVHWLCLLIGSSVQSKEWCSALLTICLARTWKSIYQWQGHSKQHPCGVGCFWPWHSTDAVWELHNLCADVVHIINACLLSCMKIFHDMQGWWGGIKKAREPEVSRNTWPWRLFGSNWNDGVHSGVLWCILFFNRSDVKDFTARDGR